MALTSSTNKITYNGDGSTPSFALPYLVYDATHVKVYLNDVLQGTGYTVSGVGDAGGVTITFSPTVPALNVLITLQRIVPLTQLAIYDVAGAFPAKTTEKNFDLAVMRAQQHETARLRSLRQADGDGADITTIPLLAARANKYLTFDSSGNPTATAAATASGTSVLATGSTTARLLADRFADIINVRDHGVIGDGVTDDYSALQTLITNASSGDIILFPNDMSCKTSAPILCEDKVGLTILASGGYDQDTASCIYGAHTGKAILSLVGSRGIHIIGLKLHGDSTTTPKTGLLLGRSSAASAGNHTFDNLKVTGKYSEAGIYNVCSESNTWINPIVSVIGAPKAAVYISETDALSIGGLTASVMTQETFLGGNIANTDTTAGSAALYIKGGSNLGHLAFHGTFLAKDGGDSFITIDISATVVRPLVFIDVVGEHSGATRPTNGLHIKGTAGAHLHSFVADPIGFDALTNAIKCETGLGQFINSRIRWFSVTDGQVMDLNAGYGSDFHFRNNGVMNFPNGLYSSRLIYNYASGPTIGTSRAGSTVLRDTGGAGNRYPVTILAFTSLDTTPSVAGGSIFTVTQGAGTTITTFDDGVAGQEITLIFTDGNTTIAETGNIKLSAAFTSSADDTMRLIFDGSNWYELSRSVN